MIHTIRNRLEAVERSKKNMNVPEVVFIYWDDNKACWIAKEQYIKKNSKGKPITKTGTVKQIPLEAPEDYTPPEGFRGSILIERDIE